jgi:16S rRNA (cytosine967-C5)-methyltransferase
VQLDEPVPVSALPGFQAGVVSVQDAGAQLAAVLLDAKPGMRVLDACAAPGGKTAHILQRTPDLAELVAVDSDADRVERIRENLERLSGSAAVAAARSSAINSPSHRAAGPDALAANVRLIVADMRQTLTFREHLPRGRPFDRVLVDAPCSSTGVIRRHPDIKLLRRLDDIPSFAKAQLEILRSGFGLLAVGGRLVYCTCSVLPEENEGVLERFLQAEAGAQVVDLSGVCALPPGAAVRGPGVQLLPGSEAGTDGFYYACVEKTTSGT